MNTMLLDHPALAPEIDDELTRRRLLSGIGVLGLSVTLAGCAEDEETAGASAPAPAPSPSPSGPFPVRIDHAYGTTQIPAEPRRVLTVGYVDQDAVLALGFVPVGARDWIGERPPLDYPWQQRATGGASAESLPFELDFEQIAALRPDLILAIWAGITDEEYATLSRIAPTVAHESAYAADPFLAPWQGRTRLTGRVLGREDQARELVAELEARFAEVRGRNPQFEGAGFALAEGPFDGNFFVYTATNPRGLIIENLGFAVPEEIARLDEGSGVVTISEEQLPLVDQDVLVWLGSDPASVRESPLYAQLDAVGEGREVFTDELLQNALAFGSVLSLSYALERLEPMLAAAVDGDPATPVPQDLSGAAGSGDPTTEAEPDPSASSSASASATPTS